MKKHKKMILKKILSIVFISLFSISCSDNSIILNNKTNKEENIISTIPKNKLLNKNKISFDGSIYTLKKVISKNVSIYERGNSKILHARVYSKSKNNSNEESLSKNSQVLPKDVISQPPMYFDGVYKKFDIPAFGYLFFKGALGVYRVETDYDYQSKFHIARQVVIFNYISIPKGAKYENVTIELVSYKYKYDIDNHDGEILLSLVGNDYVSGSSFHYRSIANGERLGLLVYNREDKTNSVELTSEDVVSMEILKDHIEKTVRDVIRLGLRAVIETPSGASTQLKYVDLFIKYKYLDIAKATYNPYSDYLPILGSVEIGVDLTIKLDGWPEGAQLEYIVYDKYKAASPQIVNSNDGSIYIEARILKQTAIHNGESQRINLSDRLVYTLRNGTTGFVEIENWKYK